MVTMILWVGDLGPDSPIYNGEWLDIWNWNSSTDIYKLWIEVADTFIYLFIQINDIQF